MTRPAALVPAVLLALACERNAPTTPPEDGADDGAAAADDAGEAEPEPEEPEGSKRPVPVEQVLEIDGKLPKEAIDQQLQDHINEIRACFDEALQHPDGLELKGAV